MGIRTAREVCRRDPGASVILYGDEACEPYNRICLSSFLTGELSWQALTRDAALPPDASVVARYGCRVTAIDRPNRCVRDAHLLLARRVRSRRTVILGGGLLGLEAVRAMQRFDTEVRVVEHYSRLMMRQLDQAAADELRSHIEALGIRIVLGEGVKRVFGQAAVTGVQLRNDRVIECDTILVATGIVPNTELALAAGLPIGRGIVGETKGELVIASPVYKQHFSLTTGRCLEDPQVCVPVFTARLENDIVKVEG